MKAERMLCIPSKEKNMKRISIMTASIERPEYLFSKLEMMSRLEDLPCSALGSLYWLTCLFHHFVSTLNIGGEKKFFWSLKVRRVLVQFQIYSCGFKTSFFCAVEQREDGGVGQRGEFLSPPFLTKGVFSLQFPGVLGASPALCVTSA